MSDEYIVTHYKQNTTVLYMFSAMFMCHKVLLNM